MFIIIVLLELVSVAGYIETRYTCCQGDLGAEGCQVAKVKQAIDKWLYVHKLFVWYDFKQF